MRTRRPIPAHNLKTTRTGDVKRRNVFWRWRRLFFLLALVMITGVAGVGFVVAQIELPTTPPIEDQTTFICGAEVGPGQCDEDTAMATLHGEEDRTSVRIDRIPQVVIDAVIAAEDRDFFEHGGVDPVGISRAALSDIRGSSASRQGGSTITQQYVKNVYLTNERTLTRKIREAVMAIKLEQEISKEKILENYLNTIYFGRGSYGIQAAARAYFNKDVSAVNLPEAALLAGLIRSPQRAEPYKYPEEARRRRRTVLDAMLEEGKITKPERDLSDQLEFSIENGLALWAPSEGVEMNPAWTGIGAEYFVEHVRKQLTAKYGTDALFGGGLRIYTTIDRTRQAQAYQAVTETLNQPGDPAGALVAINETGSIQAMMGGRDYAADQVNLATGKSGGGLGRQPGSTFKAFALAEAVREGYSVESQIASPSVASFPNANGGADWTPTGGCCGGQTTLIEATARSSNTSYAQLATDLGPAAVARMANDLGVSVDFGEEPYPSLVLGTAEVSVLDMAAAYSTFANEGSQIDARAVTRVERADGTLLAEFPVDRTQVLTPTQTAKVTYALQQVIDHGTGEAADFGRPAAGKTGTTQENKDAWFVGYTPRLTAAVWMGYADGTNMDDVRGGLVQGGTLPAEIWRRFMELASEGQDTGAFDEPGDLGEGRVLYPDLEVPAASTPGPGPDGTGTTTPGIGTDGTDPGGSTGGTTPLDPGTTDPTDPGVTVPPVTVPPVVPGGAGTGTGVGPDG